MPKLSHPHHSPEPPATWPGGNQRPLWTPLERPRRGGSGQKQPGKAENLGPTTPQAWGEDSWGPTQGKALGAKTSGNCPFGMLSKKS